MGCLLERLWGHNGKRDGGFNIFYFGGGKGDVLISGEKL